MNQRLYIVTYDITDPRRWRKVFTLMNGYGEWIQLSVFQCRLSLAQQAELVSTLHRLVNQREDHVLIVDLGPADQVRPRVISIGKSPFKPLDRSPIII